MNTIFQLVPKHCYSVPVGALFAHHIGYVFSHYLDRVAAYPRRVGTLIGGLA